MNIIIATSVLEIVATVALLVAARLLMQIIDIARASNDVQMRVLVAMHKELCRMNDRFTPMQGPVAPEVPEHLRAALHAIRPEVPR